MTTISRVTPRGGFFILCNGDAFFMAVMDRAYGGRVCGRLKSRAIQGKRKVNFFHPLVMGIMEGTVTNTKAMSG